MTTLNVETARRLTTTTKTHPILTSVTPKWLLKFLHWVDLEAGHYRVNRVTDPVGVMADHGIRDLVKSDNNQYDNNPPEYNLVPIQTVIQVPIRIADLQNSPYNQVDEQVRLGVENLKELQELHMITSPDIGLLGVTKNKISVDGPPTPDDLDNLITLVWKDPTIFLLHPKTISKFGHECTKRGVCIGSTKIFGSIFTTWRGIPLIPCDKIPIIDNKTNILLLRIGEKTNGIIGLTQTVSDSEYGYNITKHCKGVTDNAMVEYLLTLYYSIAVLSDDAIGMCENVIVSG